MPRSCQLSVITASSGMWATLKQHFCLFDFIILPPHCSKAKSTDVLIDFLIRGSHFFSCCTCRVPADTLRHTGTSGVLTESHRTLTHINLRPVISAILVICMWKKNANMHVSCEVKWTHCGISTSWRVHCRLSSFLHHCTGFLCHPPYRSVYCNVKYHCTLEDIVWQFCQGSLEYFFLIALTATSRKWIPCVFFCSLFFSGLRKITWF